MPINQSNELLDTDGENRAVRWFLAAYGGGVRHTVGNMKTHLRNCGYPYWPTWVDEPGEDAQHLTKGGAQDWLRYLFDLEKPVAQDARQFFDAGWKAAALFCDREDVVADGVIGEGGCPQFETAFIAAIAAQQGDSHE